MDSRKAAAEPNGGTGTRTRTSTCRGPEPARARSSVEESPKVAEEKRQRARSPRREEESPQKGEARVCCQGGRQGGPRRVAPKKKTKKAAAKKEEPSEAAAQRKKPAAPEAPAEGARGTAKPGRAPEASAAEVVRAKAEKLTGPTVVGKIELPVEKKPTTAGESASASALPRSTWKLPASKPASAAAR